MQGSQRRLSSYTIQKYGSDYFKVCVHQANIVQRNVRFADIFLLPNDQVLLNDLGASTEGGSRQLIQGWLSTTILSPGPG